jgi:hypothetical protein
VTAAHSPPVVLRIDRQLGDRGVGSSATITETSPHRCNTRANVLRDVLGLHPTVRDDAKHTEEAVALSVKKPSNERGASPVAARRSFPCGPRAAELVVVDAKLSRRFLSLRISFPRHRHGIGDLVALTW